MMGEAAEGTRPAPASDDLLVSRRAGLVTATFNRPHARNALTFAMYDDLASLATAAADDDGTTALIVTGAGPDAFAAGTDIAQFASCRGHGDALASEARVERVLAAV